MSDFKLWEGRKAVWLLDKGRFVAHGKRWAFVPDDELSPITPACSEVLWEEEVSLTFIDEHPGYERVEVNNWNALQVGDIFIAQGKEHPVEFLPTGNPDEVGHTARRAYLNGMCAALGSVLRPYTKEEK